MQLPNRFENKMEKLISEFPPEIRTELTEYYYKTIRDSIKDNKITKNTIYSLHAAFTYKKYLNKKKNNSWEVLVDEFMELKAIEYREEILKNLNTKIDYYSDKEFIYMPEKWMQILVMNIREDCNLKSEMKLRKEIKEMLNKHVLNELIKIFLGNKKFGYKGNLLLVNLIFYEKHIGKIDEKIWEIFLLNFEKGKLIKLSQIRRSLN